MDAMAREQLAARLKAYREKEGLTQEQMAEKLGVSRMAYGYYENGKRTADIEFISRLRNISGHSTDFFLGLPMYQKADMEKCPPAFFDLMAWLEGALLPLFKEPPEGDRDSKIMVRAIELSTINLMIRYVRITGDSDSYHLWCNKDGQLNMAAIAESIAFNKLPEGRA